MRRVYLMRHGQPEPLDGQRRCISSTDLQLSAEGIRQAGAAAEYLADRGIAALYSSPLTRCRRTADVIGARLGLPVIPENDLAEVSCGEWEGLTFSEIRGRWPALYALRGAHMGTTAPPGGESFLQAGKRLDSALRRMLAQAGGDLAVVTHGGIMRGWLCPLLGQEPDTALTVRQPWGGITEAEYDGEFHIAGYGIRPGLPIDADIERLYRKHETPPEVIAHCRAVAQRGAGLAKNAGRAVDLPLLHAAALLHDLCRADGRDHPARAAKVLDAGGWPRLADTVARHHDPGENPTAEAELLALADRLTEGTDAISIEDRFARSRGRCATDEALAAWQRRYDEALRLYEKYCK